MDKQIIGRNALVDISGYCNVPAKIDTGADSSAIWVSNVEVTPDHILKFTFFGPGSPFYDGKIISINDFKAVITRSSHGDEKIFYRTPLTVVIAGREICSLFTLSNRKRNLFPILIGRRTLAGNFIVDVEKQIIDPPRAHRTRHLNDELQKNPYQFHLKYIKNNCGDNL